MFITKNHLSRRTFLRGALGTAVALPFLDAMVPALVAQSKTAATSPYRLGFIYTPNGMSPGRWEPVGEGTTFKMASTMKSLEPFREQMVIVSGLYQGNPNSAHMTASAMWLNGAFPKRTQSSDIGAAVSIDQMVAAKIGRNTLLPSLELGTEELSAGACDPGYSCIYFNTMAWRTPTAPLPVEINPRVVFQRLFSETGSSEQRAAKLSEKRSILDAAISETAALQRKLGPGDRSRLVEYLDNIRQVEQRIQRAEQQADSSIELPTAPSGVPESYDDHVNLMFDLQLIAWQADLTRVFSFLMGREASNRCYPQIGVPTQHHGISHHGGKPTNLDEYAKINEYHTGLTARFIEKLRATPDGDGTLLDHSLLMYGSGMSDGDSHDRSNLPIALIGGANGRLKGGRRIVHKTKTPLSNLLVSIGEISGLTLEDLGESNGRVAL